MGANRAGHMVAAAVMAMAATGALGWADGGVRPLQARGAHLLDEGLRRSAARRDLVDHLQQSDVVV